jgi:putative transcriptional regulator
MYNTKKLRKLRLEKGYTIYDMAKLIGISYSHYSLIENKKRNLSYEMAIKIAKIFDKKPDDIFL